MKLHRGGKRLPVSLRSFCAQARAQRTTPRTWKFVVKAAHGPRGEQE